MQYIPMFWSFQNHLAPYVSSRYLITNYVPQGEIQYLYSFYFMAKLHMTMQTYFVFVLVLVGYKDRGNACSHVINISALP